MSQISEIKHNVPFSSQYIDLGDHEWRARGCGIAAVKMLMDFWHGKDAKNQTTTLDEVLRAALKQQAHILDIGWSHAGLLRTTGQYGYHGYNIDVNAKSPTPKTPDEAWGMLLQELEAGPVLVSVWRHLEPEPQGGHMIVVTGWDGQLLSLNDPIELTERDGRKFLTKDAFQKLSKQRYIIIRPSE